MAHLNMSLTGGGYTGIEAINYYVARHVVVSKGLAAVAGPIYAKAKAKHAIHKDQGHSYVGIDQGDVDYYIYLDDDRGLDQALAIEFGYTHHITGEWVHGIRALTGQFE